MEVIFIDIPNIDENYIKLKIYNSTPLFSTMGQEINQPSFIYNTLVKAVNKMADTLNSKWNTKFSFDDSDNVLSQDLFNEIYDKYGESETLKDFFSADNINEIKRNVGTNFVYNLENYNDKYNIPTENFSKIKSEGLELLSQNLDEQFEKSFALDVEEKLQTLCNDWQCAHSNLDYDLMNEKTKEINKFYKGQYLYKDEKLINNIQYILIKNGYINKKIENGNDPVLSELEEETLKEVAHLN